MGSEVINYSHFTREGTLILHTEVGIGYEVAWQDVEAMLIEAARRTPGALANPAPFVLQTGLGDYSPVYELNIHTRNEKAMPATYSALHAAIQDVFAERGVQIMTPHYVADPPDAKIPPTGSPDPTPGLIPAGPEQNPRERAGPALDLPPTIPIVRARSSRRVVPSAFTSGNAGCSGPGDMGMRSLPRDRWAMTFDRGLWAGPRRTTEQEHWRA